MPGAGRGRRGPWLPPRSSLSSSASTRVFRARRGAAAAVEPEEQARSPPPFGVGARPHRTFPDARLASLTANEFIEAVLRRGWARAGSWSATIFASGGAGRGSLPCCVALRGPSASRLMPTGQRGRRARIEQRDPCRTSPMASWSTRPDFGSPLLISGRVAHGDKLGAARLSDGELPSRHKPALAGVFAVRVHGSARAAWACASLGVRPTWSLRCGETSARSIRVRSRRGQCTDGA